MHSMCHVSMCTTNRNHSCEHLKMIGKGFVLFKINSSPSAFYIIKPTCIVIGFYPRDAMLARVIVIVTCPPVLCQNEES